MRRSCARFSVLAVIVLCVAPPARAFVEHGPIVNPANGHSYYQIAINTWASAEVEAQGLGGHLVAISDAAENAWVWSTFAPFGSAPFWIGANDVANEGYFVWSNGEPWWYQAWWWEGGEPNNAGGVEHWAEINNGVWNDTDGYGPNSAIVEVEDEPLLLFVEAEPMPPNPSPQYSTNITGLAVSADGANVYATWNVAIGDDKILVYDRAPDGSLTQIDAQSAPGNPNAMALSPDGSALFVASNNGEIEAWRRDAGTGLVTFADQVYDGSEGGNSLQFASAVAVSPDGKNLYVVGGENAITTFAWDGVAGTLTVIDTDLSNAAGIPFEQPGSVAVTPDGVFVLVTSFTGRSLVVFAREPATGTLAVALQLVDGVGGVTGIGFPLQVVAVDAEQGSTVYVVGTAGNLVRFTELGSGPAEGVAFVEAVPVGVGAGRLAPSANGATLFMVDGFRSGAHAVERDPASGALGGLFDSIYSTDAGVDGLVSPVGIAASPDGANVYVAGFEAITVLSAPEPGGVAIGLAALIALRGVSLRRRRS